MLENATKYSLPPLRRESIRAKSIKSISIVSPVEALLLASTVIVQALIDVVTRLLLAAHQFKPEAGIVCKVHEIQPQVPILACQKYCIPRSSGLNIDLVIPGLDGLRKVHHGHRVAIEDAEFHRRPVNVSELSHLV